jgi:ketosteroid isomerase-like protein
MTDASIQPVSRSTVQAFYQAYAKRDLVRLADLIDDDADWIITGPVDLMRFCGHRRGKAAVLALFAAQLPDAFKITGFSPDTLVIDGDRAAMLGRLSGIRRDSGRKISYQVAHFVRFQSNKVVEFRSLIDSFDAAEQMLGHSIDVSTLQAAGLTPGDLITV